MKRWLQHRLWGVRRRILEGLTIKALEEAVVADQQTARTERMALDARILTLEIDVAKLQAAAPLQNVRESAPVKQEPLRAKNFREFVEAVEPKEEAANV